MLTTIETMNIQRRMRPAFAKRMKIPKLLRNSKSTMRMNSVTPKTTTRTNSRYIGTTRRRALAPGPSASRPLLGYGGSGFHAQKCQHQGFGFARSGNIEAAVEGLVDEA